jgi:hypothetical protein
MVEDESSRLSGAPAIVGSVHATTMGPDGFFDDEDAAAARHPSPEESRAPAWMQAPDDELPARLLLDSVIARKDAAVLVLREVRVFSAGFEVHVDWFLRRRSEDAWEWQRLAESATRGAWGRSPNERDASLRFGLASADGKKVRSVDVTLAMPGGEAPEPPTTMQRHGGGGGGERSFTGSSGLWVWAPDRLRGQLTFVTEWAQVGIPATAVSLDGDEIADAAGRVRPLWEGSVD